MGTERFPLVTNRLEHSWTLPSINSQTCLRKLTRWLLGGSSMIVTLTCLISGGVRLLEIYRKKNKIGKILARKTIFLSPKMALMNIEIIKSTQNSVHVFCTHFHTPGKALTHLRPTPPRLFLTPPPHFIKTPRLLDFHFFVYFYRNV